MNQPEDHMDELFRKAGENYPLKTDGSDWDKVLTGLQSGAGSGADPVLGVGSSIGSRQWRWLLLLLLLPLGWIGAHYAMRHSGSAPVSPVASATTKPATSTTPATSAPATSAPATSSAATSAGSGTPGGSAPVASAPMTPGTSTAPAATAPLSGSSGSVASKPVPHASAFGLASPDRSAPVTSASTSPVVSASPDGSAPVASAASGAFASPAVGSYAPWDFQAVAGGAPLTLAPDLSGRTQPSLKLEAPAASAQKPATHKTNNTVHGFYAGVLAGPDFTSIKGQAIQNPGYSMGLILGYRFNKRLSVEGAALWDHKAYYTSGEYFNKTKADIPPTITIEHMNGVCNMFEIPLSIRYDFLLLKNGGFYANAGISSYMMQLETYSYLASAPGYNPWTADKSYPHSGNDFFSMLHLSAGYRFQWGKIGEVRLEPYYKIPLRGVGVGDLPMTSAGLYIGLTHSFR